MSALMMRLSPALVLLLFAGSASAEPQAEEDRMAVAKILQVDPDRLVSLTKEQKDYAKAVGEEVVCLCGTCPRHTITQCNCGWAHVHKRTIEAALLDGKTAEQIKAAYMQAHGTKAFPEPPGKWGSLTWAVPYAGGGLLLMAFLVFGLRMRKRQESMAAVGNAAAASTTIGTDDEDRAILSRELEDLD